MDANTLVSTPHAESSGVTGAPTIPEHLSFHSDSRGRASLRRFAFLGACALVALGGCASGGSGGSPASASSQVSPRQMDGVFEPLVAPSALEDPHESVCTDLSLPFEIIAMHASDHPCALSPSGQTQAASVNEKWSLGGDFRQIPSLPIDNSQVFGSSTHDPNDLYSYKPAILTPQGARDLSADLLREDGNYVEPLDGTQNGPWITFLGRQVSSSSTGDHQEDNVSSPWTIYSWNMDEQRLHTVMTWSDLPAHSPRSAGELPPVSDGTHAFYGAKASTDHGDFSLVVTQGLDDSTRSDKPQILLFGAYPATSQQGLSVVATPKDSSLPSRVVTLSGTDFSAVTTHFDLKSQDYRVGGLYGAGDHHAVLVTPLTTSSAASSYLGIWNGRTTDYPTQWIMVDSRTPWVSIGEEAIVWGAGSQANNAQMYLRSWKIGQIARLGETPGYSRPVLAARGHTVMIPRVNSQGGIQWTIGEFTAE
ncbi:hypothetical protein [uncultured Actinomyces sp.]|uniref:hypothetical protein n=1 Tax=uncultured Actinomyces sp. TaxID=249061 RepID=UPI0028E9216B|nr:hypothetical protein [uncultured Actinomyces sp.]